MAIIIISTICKKKNVGYQSSHLCRWSNGVGSYFFLWNIQSPVTHFKDESKCDNDNAPKGFSTVFIDLLSYSVPLT